MSTFRRLVLLAAPFRGWLLLAMLLSFGVLAAGIGLMAMSAYLISKAVLVAGFATLALTVTAVRSLAISRAVLRYCERYISHLVTFRILTRLRSWFYAAIEPLAPARLQEQRSGDLLARITTDIETLDNFYIRGLVTPIAALLAIGFASAILAAFDPRMGLLLLLLLCFAGIALPLLQRHASKAASMQLVGARAGLTTAAADGIQGLADLIAFGRQDRMQAEMLSFDASLTQSQRRLGYLRAGIGAMSALTACLAAVAVLLLAVPLVSNGKLDGIYLALLPLTAIAAFEAAQVLAGATDRLEESEAAGRRLFALIDEPPPLTAPALLRMQTAGHSIEFRDVGFRYELDDAPVLEDLSFVLPEGGCLFLTGPSGAGKSTVLSLLLRFWQPRSGQVILGGRDLATFDEEDARALFAVVPQQVYLFNGTVRDNLLLARGDATDVELEAACRRALLHDFLLELPDGYDTPVGENGFQLSGGQRQQLAIARAILKDAPILLLDEPTTNLDAALVGRVWQSLRELMRGRTTLVISHDLGRIEENDLVLRLD